MTALIDRLGLESQVVYLIDNLILIDCQLDRRMTSCAALALGTLETLAAARRVRDGRKRELLTVFETAFLNFREAHSPVLSLLELQLLDLGIVVAFLD
jgi:hypothetical protein